MDNAWPLAAIILAAGTKGRRFALPNSKVMIHQPWGQVMGQITDMEIQANEFEKDRHRLNEILTKHTGQPLERIAKETDRDRYFHALEAKEFGLVDEVVTDAGAARARLATLASHPADAYALVKRDLRGTAEELCPEEEQEKRLREDVVRWTSPALREMIARVLAR